MKSILSIIAVCALLTGTPALAAGDDQAGQQPASQTTEASTQGAAPAAEPGAPGNCPMVGTSGMMSGSSMHGGAMPQRCMMQGGGTGHAGNNGMMSGDGAMMGGSAMGAGMPACSATVRDRCMESAGHMLMHRAEKPAATKSAAEPAAKPVETVEAAPRGKPMSAWRRAYIAKHHHEPPVKAK